MMIVSGQILGENLGEWYTIHQIFKPGVPGFLRLLLCGCMCVCVCVSAPEGINN